MSNDFRGFVPGRIDRVDIDELTQMHREVAQLGRAEPPQGDIPWMATLYGLAFQNAMHNRTLWYYEDRVRSPAASSVEVMECKRAIDEHNQRRNDWIDNMNEWLIGALHHVAPLPDALLNTETLGSVIDRLSILALRIYHLKELGAPETLAVAESQLADLTTSAQELADDLFAGRKRHKTWRVLKLYNNRAAAYGK
jgi:hypothetical protein